MHVEAPEVDQLARRVDLGLVGRLALSQHRRGVDPGAPRPGEEVGGLEQDRGPVVEGQVAPGGCGGFAASTAAAASAFVAPRVTPSTLRWACGWRTSILGPLPVTRAPPIVCGSSWLRRRQLDERHLERGPLGAAGGVVEDGLVGGGRDVGHSVHAVGLLASGHDVGMAPTLAPRLPAAQPARRRRDRRALAVRAADEPRTSASSVTSYQSRSVGDRWRPGSSSTWKDTMRRRSTGADSSTRDAASAAVGCDHGRRVDVGGRHDPAHRAAGRAAHGLVAGREPGEVLQLLLVGDQPRPAQRRRSRRAPGGGRDRAGDPAARPARSSAVRAR